MWTGPQTEALMYWPSDSEVNTSVKTEVWDFPVMTERTRLISYLLYGLFSALLEKNKIKTPEVIFHISLRVLWFSSSLILKKHLYASFSFSYWKYSCTLSSFFVVFAHALVAFTHSHRAEKNFHNARSLQENLARSAATESERAYYCSHIINNELQLWLV